MFVEGAISTNFKQTFTNTQMDHQNYVLLLWKCFLWSTQISTELSWSMICLVTLIKLVKHLKLSWILLFCKVTNKIVCILSSWQSQIKIVIGNFKTIIFKNPKTFKKHISTNNNKNILSTCEIIDKINSQMGCVSESWFSMVASRFFKILPFNL